MPRPKKRMLRPLARNLLLLVLGLSLGIGIRLGARPDDRDTSEALAVGATGLSAAAPKPTEEIVSLLNSPAGLEADANFCGAVRGIAPDQFSILGRQVLENLRSSSAGSDETRDRSDFVFQRWVQVDLPGAKANLAIGPSARSEANVRFLPLLKCLAHADAAWVWEQFATRFPPGSEMDHAVRIEAAAAGLPAALRWFEAIPDDEQHWRVLLHLPALDPMARMSVALGKSEPYRQLQMATTVIAAAEQGVGVVRQLLSAVPDRQERYKLALEAMEPLATETVANPFALLNEIVPAEDLDLITRDLGSRLPSLVEARPDAAADWALALPDARKEMLDKVLLEWLSRDPLAATQWMRVKDAEFPGLARRAEQSLRFLELRAGKQKQLSIPGLEPFPGVDAPLVGNVSDPRAIAQMLRGAEPSDVAATFSQNTARALLEEDFGFLTTWLQNLAPGEIRDAAIGAVISDVATVDHTKAAQWLPLISSEAARRDHFSQVYRIWAQVDPVAARSWADQFSAVDPAWKARYFRLSE